MTEISPLLKILVVFAGILAINRLRVPLSVALVLGGVAFNWWGGNDLPAVMKNFAAAVANIDLWLLMAITALVVEFGRELADPRNTGALSDVTRRFGGKSGRLWSLMILPALIGLMPMPAGALFSAPMVQQTAHEDHWKPEWKAAVNYWFRHVWEYWWPIYPAVIIGIAVFKMETWRFIATMLVFTPAAFAAGYFFLIRPHRRSLVMETKSAASSLGRFFILMWPVAVVIICVLLLPPVLTRLVPAIGAQTNKLLAMLIGSLLGLAIIWRRTRGRKKMFVSFFEKRNLSILFTIGAVIFFQSMLESSRLLPAASAEMVRSGISVVPVVALLPFLAGFITGIAAGFAGIAFPLIVGLLDSGGCGLTPMATLALAFGFGYMGMMLSPIHLCLIMTRDYFSASLLPIYRQLALCVSSQFVFAILVFMILGALRL
jgi:hypothetical protein